MTKEQLQARNLELVRICDKETTRADSARDALNALYGSLSYSVWDTIPLDVKTLVIAALELEQ